MTVPPSLNLVFDLGQVMIRWEPVALLKRFIPHRCGTDEPAHQLAEACFRSPAWSAFDAGLLDTDGVAQALATILQEPERLVRAMVVDIAHALLPIANSVALLQQLHLWRNAQTQQSLRLFYLSNMPEPYAAHLTATHDFFNCFDGGVFSARVKRAKPDPAIYAHAEEVLELIPAQTIFFDDHLPNVKAATDRGWQGVHVPDPDHLQTLLPGWLTASSRVWAAHNRP
ncbi:MAG: HAD family phosphatase [Betaproteobacteria bacterium]|nr:HAD family phosphatase [Betaproteobacteria bacterium]